MSAGPPSLLQGSDEHLLPWVPIALAVHAAFVLLVLLLAMIEGPAPRPLIDPDEVIEVGLVSMPKSERLPERATRTNPSEVAAAPPPSPEPAPEAPAAPPPAPVPDAAPIPDRPAPPTETTPDAGGMEEHLAELERQRLLDELAADEGPVDRDASSPEGSEDAPPTTSSGGIATDPALAAWTARISGLFTEQFRPLPLLKGKGLVAKVLIRVADDGRIQDRRIQLSSGDASWDRAAMSATEALTSVPLPPETHRDGSPTELVVVFEDPR